jgi:nitrite reductase/ring-hydroxylating ferredoxin subunit
MTLRRQRICRADEVGEGQAHGFDPMDEGRDILFVVRWLGGLQAWRNACPHINGAPMAWRKDGYLSADGSRIVCHAHGAQFLPDTGLCVSGPCLGKKLTPVQIVVETDGDLFAVEEE